MQCQFLLPNQLDSAGEDPNTSTGGHGSGMLGPAAIVYISDTMDD